MSGINWNIRDFRIQLLCFCLMGSSFLYGATLSFNSLFPLTWYEKGFDATLFVWHTMCSVIDNAFESEAFDIILGKCAFACFCFEKMYQENQKVLEEDIVYLQMLLSKLEQRLTEFSTEMAYRDRVACLKYMIANITKLLQIPSDI